MEKLGSQSRRDFLKNLTAGALGLFTVSFFGKNNEKENLDVITDYYRIYQNLLDYGIRSGIETAIVNKEAIEFVKKVYRVEIFESLKAGAEGSILKDFRYTVIEDLEVDSLDKNQICIMLKIIFREIVKYPKDFFIKNKIERFVLVKDIKRKNKGIGGLAINDLSEIIIAFEYNASAVDTVFHHELYHLADWNDDGFAKDDKRWKEIHQCSCNPYILEDRQYYNLDDSFVSKYSETNPQEDRATMASVLMVKGLDYVEELLEAKKEKKTYEIFLKKILKIKEDYLKFSQGKIDDYFLRIIKKGQTKPEFFLGK